MKQNMTNKKSMGRPTGNPRNNTFEAPKRTGSAPPAPQYGFNPMMQQAMFMSRNQMPRGQFPTGNQVRPRGHVRPRGQIRPSGQARPRGPFPRAPQFGMPYAYPAVMYQQMFVPRAPHKKIDVVVPKKTRKRLVITSSKTGEAITSDRKKEEPKPAKETEDKVESTQQKVESTQQKEDNEEEEKRKKEAAKLVADKELKQLLERQRMEEELKKEKLQLQKERLEQQQKKEQEEKVLKQEEEQKKAAAAKKQTEKKEIVVQEAPAKTEENEVNNVPTKKSGITFRPRGGLKLRPERVVSSPTTTTTTTAKSSGPKIVFLKEQLRKLKDSSKDLSPSWLIGKIIKINPMEMSKTGGGVGSSGSRFAPQDSIRRRAQGRFPSSSSSSRSSNNKYGSSSYSTNSADSGGYHSRQQEQYTNNQFRPSKSSQQSSWQRGVKQPQQQANNKNNRKQRNHRNKHGYDSPPLDGYEPKKSSNAWSRDKIKTDDANEVTLRKCRNQLNKLTPEKFQRISENILDITIENRVVFKGLIYAIFDMALIQPVYSSMYAQLCALVYKKAETVFTTRITKVKKNSNDKWEYDVGDPDCKSPEFASETEARNAGQKIASFKRILLTKCQMEFQKEIEWDAFAKGYDWDKLDDLETERAKAEVEYKTNMAKKRMLGNIKFIGELFIKKMLSGKIMFHCIHKMLYVAGEDNSVAPQLEYIESVCKLFTVIGKQLDEHPKYKSMVDVYFKRLKDLKNTMKKLEARIKFMIDDLFELRARRWKPRRDEKAPATIAQVRQQAAQEELNKRSANSDSRARNTKSHHRSSHDRGGSERRDGSFNMPTVFSSSSKDTRGRHQSSSRSQKKDAVRQQSQSRRNNNNSRLSTSSGSRLNLQPQRGVRNTTSRRQGDDSKKSTKTMSVEVYKKKCKSTVKEYLNSLDTNEVKECLAEYGQKDNSPFVVECLNVVIESSPRKVEKLIVNLANLYSFLVKESSLRDEDLEKGFKSILGEEGLLDDLAIDIPKFPKYLGSFFAVLIESNVVDLSVPMKQFHSSSIESGRAQEILKYTLSDLKSRNKDTLLKQLKRANLSSVLGEKSLQSFLESCEMKDVAKML